MAVSFVTRVEVAWGDCDAAGIVFYPQFFRFMDTAFQQLLRSRGTGQRRLQADYGVIGTPLLEASATFRSPARFDDVLELTVTIDDWTSKVMHISYRAMLEERLVFEGKETRALVAELDGRLRSIEIPQALRTQLEG